MELPFGLRTTNSAAPTGPGLRTHRTFGTFGHNPPADDGGHPTGDGLTNSVGGDKVIIAGDGPSCGDWPPTIDDLCPRPHGRAGC